LIAISARLLLGEIFQFRLYAQILPMGLFCMLGYAIQGLYSVVALDPVAELRRLSLTTTAITFGVAGLTFFARNPEEYSRLTVGLTWLFSLGTVPLGRNLLRAVAARLGLWGEPVLVIGYGDIGRRLVQHLRVHRTTGYYPVAVVDGHAAENYIDKGAGLSVFAAPAGHLDTPGFEDIRTAILIPAEVSQSLAERVVKNDPECFRHLILIPDQVGISSLGVTPVTLNGMMSLEVHDNLLSNFARFQKRLVDILSAGLFLLLLSPILGLVALLVKLTSRGPVFYPQERVGKDGQIFKMVKFRTMCRNAHQELAELLKNDPGLRAEWDKYQKLKHDPRLTPVGEFLRCYSIDELPQLWNVLKGEMSLVGPRPFFPEQRELYGEGFSYYIRVLPGITGMWQVTVRNQSEFIERAYWDEYYVRNWSIWLDIYILARTVWVVLRREGAY
jgi:Undecaprenyl-phosphate galactose phosphotransferase WbaP